MALLLSRSTVSSLREYDVGNRLRPRVAQATKLPNNFCLTNLPNKSGTRGFIWVPICVEMTFVHILKLPRIYEQCNPHLHLMRIEIKFSDHVDWYESAAK